MIKTAIFLSILWLISIAWFFFGNAIMEGPRVSLPVPDAQPLVQNERGLYEIERPLSTLGGSEPLAFLTVMQEEADLYEQATEIWINEDGNIVMAYTPELLEQQRQMVYLFVTEFSEREYLSSIKEVIYHDDLFSDITILVDWEEYYQQWFDRLKANRYLSTWIGIHQMLHGVAPDEWRATITVRCHRTNTLITRNEFPDNDFDNQDW